MLNLLLHRRVRLAVFICCCALLMYGLFRPQSPPDLFNNSDKWLHLIAFMAFAGCARLAFWRVSGWLIWPILLASGPLLEYLQHVFQPVRYFSGWDAAANGVGVLSAFVVLTLLNRPLSRVLD